MTKNGQVLSGRYELQSRLGEGAMATVFMGSDKLLGRRVAVKVLAPHHANDKRFVERFRREAQAAAGLNHPNVVSIFDTGSDDGVHYIVMEHVEGRTLAEIIRQGALPPARAAAIATDVCRALTSAHEKGMVHRDVKPGNVLLTSDGAVKVADFGIARVASGEPLTVTGSIMGTASYLSPEQARGGDIDSRSDVYSLGCVLYEMLTGTPPFEGDTAVAIAYKHVEEEPIAPSSVNPSVPPALDAVVRKAMAKNPTDRYQTAAAMAGELQDAVPLASAAATPTETLPRQDRTAVLPAPQGRLAPTAALQEPVPRRAGRRWWPIVAAGIALAIIGVVFAVTLDGEQPLPTARDIASPTASPTPSPPPITTTPPPIPSVNDAFGQLVAALGGLDPDVQNEIFERANEALDRYTQGDHAGALEKTAELEGKVQELVAEGKIAPQDATSLVAAVAGLGASIEAFPPATPPTDESGRGEGKGKGKGQDGGEED